MLKKQEMYPIHKREKWIKKLLLWKQVPEWQKTKKFSKRREVPEWQKQVVHQQQKEPGSHTRF